MEKKMRLQLGDELDVQFNGKNSKVKITELTLDKDGMITPHGKGPAFEMKFASYPLETKDSR